MRRKGTLLGINKPTYQNSSDMVWSKHPKNTFAACFHTFCAFLLVSLPETIEKVRQKYFLDVLTRPPFISCVFLGRWSGQKHPKNTFAALFLDFRSCLFIEGIKRYVFVSENFKSSRNH